MNSRNMAIEVLAIICAFTFAGEVYARGGAGSGGGGGMGLRMRDGSCIRASSTTQTKKQMSSQTRQQLRDGSGANIGTPRKGAGQGQMRQLGPGDGTGNVTRPLDGSGYGSPAK